MRVSLIADSTFLFEEEGVRVLTDPWIGTPIYGGAWMQFPPPSTSPEDLGRLDFVFISHIHEDHCDPATLRRLDRSARILLMDRRPNFVLSFLERTGLRFADVILVPPYGSVDLGGGVTAHVLDSDPSHPLNHLIDSSLLLTWEGRRAVLFANDNQPYERTFDYVSDFELDFAALPASGGSGYPARFTNLSAREMAAEKERITTTYLSRFTEALTRLRPRQFVVCAGAHVISGHQAWLNEHMTFLDAPSIAYDYAWRRLPPKMREAIAPAPLREGCTIDLEQAAPHPWAAWSLAREPGDYTARKAAFIELASRQPYAHELIDVPADADFGILFDAAARRLAATARRTTTAFASHLYVALPTGQWGLVAPTLEHQRVARDAELLQPYLSIRCDHRLLYQLLTGAFSWNIADAAGYLEYERVPNLYDPSAVIALNYLVARPEVA